MEREIIIDGLSKKYGKVLALNEVSLNIGEGIFGLLGRNGAGKTTLMRILATLLDKSAGNVTVCGIDISEAKTIRGMIGYLPQEFSFYPNMKVNEVLDYLGLLSGMNVMERKDRVAYALDSVNLRDEQDKRVKKLSGGMKRRLGIAQAILHDPRILIIDEPTAGLDPLERVRFRDLLTKTAQDRIVILSTHIIEDIEILCDHLAVIDSGSILWNGPLSDFVTDGPTIEQAYLRLIGER